MFFSYYVQEIKRSYLWKVLEIKSKIYIKFYVESTNPNLFSKKKNDWNLGQNRDGWNSVKEKKKVTEY